MGNTSDFQISDPPSWVFRRNLLGSLGGGWGLRGGRAGRLRARVVGVGRTRPET